MGNAGSFKAKQPFLRVMVRLDSLVREMNHRDALAQPLRGSKPRRNFQSKSIKGRVRRIATCSFTP
jgi:hypothetical protein